MSKIKNKSKKDLMSNFELRKKILLYIGFIFFAAAPLFWINRIIPYELLGFADFLSPFNLNDQVYSRLFVYEPYLFGGINFAFLIAQNIPLFLFFALFNFIGVTPSLTALLFIFAILFVSEITMFHYLRYVLMEKIGSELKYITLVSFFGSIIYALSPYVIALVEPGHILQLILYATAPVILINFDKLLTQEKFSYKRLIWLFFLFFFNSTAFANIGIMYVLLVFFGVYYLPTLFIQRSFRKTLPRLLLVIFTLFISNIWWLLSFIAAITDTIKINEASTTLVNALDRAVDKASVVNIFFGRGESLLHLTKEGLPNSLYLSFPLILIFLILLFFMVYALLHTKKFTYIAQLLFVSVISLFITKGTNEPFGNLFYFFYSYLPGFQIFRRPVSKFYWVFLLVLITLAVIGLVIYLNKSKSSTRKMVLVCLLSLSAFYLWIIFILTPLLVPFSIPSYYYEAKNDLQQQNVNKLLILPGFYGTYPKYDANFNNYYGTDFLEYIWKFTMIVPDSTAYSPNLPYKKDTNNILIALKKKEAICDLTKKLGVSHIMVREDIASDASMEDNPNLLKKLLDSSQEVASKKEYKNGENKGFLIYQLNKRCTTGTIFTLNNLTKNVEYTWASPVKYHVKLSGIKGEETLSLLQNYNSAWGIYVDSEAEDIYKNKNYYTPENIFSNFTDLQYLAKNEYSKKNVKVLNYANGWTIDIPELEKLEKLHKKPDGTYTLYLTIYYKTQNFFYIGVSIFAITFLTAISYMLYSYSRKRQSSKHVRTNNKSRS